jgi:hypothetical protein
VATEKVTPSAVPAQSVPERISQIERSNLIVLEKPIRKRPRRRRKTDWQKIARRLQQAGRNFKWLGEYFERSALYIARDAKQKAVRR